MEDINLEKSLMDLRYIAQMMGIKSVTTYRKQQLIDKIMELARENIKAAGGEQIALEEVPQAKKNAAENRRHAGGRGCGCEG